VDTRFLGGGGRVKYRFFLYRVARFVRLRVKYGWE
jgi:hypothetical protein